MSGAGAAARGVGGGSIGAERRHLRPSGVTCDTLRCLRLGLYGLLLMTRRLSCLRRHVPSKHPAPRTLRSFRPCRSLPRPGRSSDAAESSVTRPTTALSINFRVTTTGASLVLSVSDNDARCNHSPAAKEHMRISLHQHYKLSRPSGSATIRALRECALLDRRPARHVDAL